jgi:hypothetical protein
MAYTSFYCDRFLLVTFTVKKIVINNIMATILKSNQREFQEDPNKTDNFGIFSDVSIAKAGTVDG